MQPRSVTREEETVKGGKMHNYPLLYRALSNKSIICSYHKCIYYWPSPLILTQLQYQGSFSIQSDNLENCISESAHLSHFPLSLLSLFSPLNTHRQFFPIFNKLMGMSNKLECLCLFWPCCQSAQCWTQAVCSSGSNSSSSMQESGCLCGSRGKRTSVAMHSSRDAPTINHRSQPGSPHEAR